MHLSLRILLPLTAVAGLASAARTQVVVDFESFDLGGQMFLDTPEMLVFTNVGGSGTDVTIQGHDDVRIYDLTLFGGSGDQALIDMNWSNFNNPLGTDITFVPSVSAVSLEAGDFGGDDDSPLAIVAYDAANNVIGSASSPWSSTPPPLAVLSITAAGIQRVHFSSGGSFQNSTFFDNLTFTPGTPPPATYCTAKVNSLGCTPAIGSSGTPSASAGSGFTIGATGVLNNKNGVLFYSTVGAQAVTFQGGFLCTSPPNRLTAVQHSGGNPPPSDCSGQYAFDFNAHIASGQDPALVAGGSVWSQYWARDPGDSFTTSLSDALAFTIGN